jgi:hypothetical protein
MQKQVQLPQVCTVQELMISPFKSPVARYKEEALGDSDTRDR